jgi:protein ImuA
MEDLALAPPPAAVVVTTKTSPRPPAASAPRIADPETLHPSLWLGHQLARQGNSTASTGFRSLDAVLPGGGWPKQSLCELLLAHPGVGEVRLLAPVLSSAQGRPPIFFNPPMQLHAATLASFGVDLDQLLIIEPIDQRDTLWALEQALKSGHVGPVVAWLPPRLRAESIRRLQLAAHNHGDVAFVFREASVHDRPSASPLRLALHAGGADRLQVRVVKRRGPPVLEPVTLELPSALAAAAKRRSASAVPAPQLSVAAA